MSENRFNSFLSGRFQTSNSTPREGVSVRIPDDEELEAQARAKEESKENMNETMESLKETISSLEAQIEELKATVKELRESPPFPDMSSFVTSREQIKSLTNAIDRQNIEITNKALVASMEQVAIMREDFFKLCSGMEKKIDSMSAKDVLASFSAYEVDMENILTDGGVFIGHFQYETLNTIHQRIVDVIPTNDPDLNGHIAERLSDGYKLGNRVLLKEKVSVYKYTEEALKEAEPQGEVPKETAEQSAAPEETISEAVQAEPANVPAETVSEEPKAEPEAPAETPSQGSEAPAAEPAQTVSKTTSRKRRSAKTKKNTTEEEE